MGWSLEVQREWNKRNPDKLVGYRQKHKKAHAMLDQIYQKKKITKDPEYRRWKIILSRFGLTKEQWFCIFENQGSCCAICKSTNPKTKLGWSTDHDPTKKKGDIGFVRGILCHICNISVSKHMTPEILRAAASYMEKDHGNRTLSASEAV